MRNFQKCLAAGALVLLASCTVGPKYVRPTSVASPAFKEPVPDSYKEMTGWKTGEPRDSVARGKWWEIFGDADLNALEEQIDINSLTIAQAEANYRGARAAVRVARAGLFPTLTTGPVVTGTQSSANSSAASTGFKPSAFATAQIPFDASWDADIWGRVRRTIESSIETNLRGRESAGLETGARRR